MSHRAIGAAGCNPVQRRAPGATGALCELGVRNQELVKMKKDNIFPQNQDKLGMRAEASEACMRGDAIHIEDG